MANRPFMFSVEMLADMTGGNKQYLSKKIKELAEDPQVQLKAVLRSKKEGYQIPEDEVLRCFPKITSGQVKEYKERYGEQVFFPRTRRFFGQERQDGQERQGMAKYSGGESEDLIEWKVRLASASPEEKKSLKMREYLESEIRRIEQLKKEKLKESLRLELLVNNCDKMIGEIREILDRDMGL